jgi:serine/threonine-protein kinase
MSEGLPPGQVVDRYVVEGLVGTGGVAVVYRARHVTLGTLHALKVLARESMRHRERMLEEARLQATLRHPNIVPVTDLLDVGGRPGLVAEYVAGGSLRRLCGQPLPLDEVERLFRGIVAGVACAHAEGMVHRDLKPENVLLDTSDPSGGPSVPRVTDFGLARYLADPTGRPRLTESGETMGTPHYMSPEQVRNFRGTDARADVFALGVILYELSVGRHPFHRDSLVDMLKAAATGAYAPPTAVRRDLPGRFQRAIEGALEPDVARRTPTCRALIEALDGGRAAPTHRGQATGTAKATGESPAVRDSPSPPDPAPAAARAASNRRPLPWIVAAAVTLAAGLAVAAAVSWIL